MSNAGHVHILLSITQSHGAEYRAQ